MAVARHVRARQLFKRSLAIEYQKQGIILQLIEHTKQALHPQAKIVLLSAPQAVDYYPHIGFTQHMSAWVKS